MIVVVITVDERVQDCRIPERRSYPAKVQHVLDDECLSCS